MAEKQSKRFRALKAEIDALVDARERCTSSEEQREIDKKLKECAERGKKLKRVATAESEGPCARAVTKLHGAFKLQFPCAQRGAGVLLNISAKFWRNSRPACRAVGYRAGRGRRGSERFWRSTLA